MSGRLTERLKVNQRSDQELLEGSNGPTIHPDDRRPLNISSVTLSWDNVNGVCNMVAGRRCRGMSHVVNTNHDAPDEYRQEHERYPRGIRERQDIATMSAPIPMSNPE